MKVKCKTLQPNSVNLDCKTNTSIKMHIELEVKKIIQKYIPIIK